MAIPSQWRGQLSVPVIAAPLFLISNPDLVVACCTCGVVGTFPALNQRSTEGFDDWLSDIRARLDTAACTTPFGVNLVVHRSNERLEADLEVAVRHKVPLIITSLGLRRDLIDAAHGYGGLVFHDVTNRRFADKALEAGVDGLIAVPHGAGGHAGRINPFAFVQELRGLFNGPLILGGAISTGNQVAAAQMMGADLAYVGSRFIATRESGAHPDHKRMIVEGRAEDIVLTPKVSGLPGNFLRPSLAAAGLDPDDLEPPETLNFGTTDNIKPWRDLWAAGHGIGAIDDIPGAADLCNRLTAEYREALNGGSRLLDQMRP
ncbi:nitronate monooxygenase [Salinihabitans flavidus]|uniref:Nitronate monooxygenase n=1 Tax=Salinihabitans flavidus TaxID=569882 RepID=A0A1H8PJL8_9RHOB|nr:nitronate monooxygenase [Salinihabitans flavidus]SEO42130.1 nitronate monooxygenase [Salinihabitans flavidus]